MNPLVAASLALLFSGPALAIPAGVVSIPTPYSPPNTVSSFPTDYVPVGTLLAHPDNHTTQTLTYDQSRIQEIITTRGPVSCIKLVYPNWLGSSGGEVDAPGAVTVSSAVEIDPPIALGVAWRVNDAGIIKLPVTFRGFKQVSIPIDGRVESDPVCWPWAAGSVIYVDTWRMSAVSNASLPTNHYEDGSKYEYNGDGYFVGVQLNSSTTASTSLDYIPPATAVFPPIKPAAFTVRGTNITGVITDDGAGNIPAGNGIASGSTINYTTGELVLKLTTATAPNAITVAGQGLYNVVQADNTLVLNPPNMSNVNTSHPIYGPSLVLGTFAAQATARPFVFGIAGDSIDYGTGSTASNYSWVNWALGGKFGIVKIAQPGSATSGPCMTPSLAWRDMSLIGPHVDRIIFNLGTNDIGSGAPGTRLATIEANWTACTNFYASLLPHGYKDLWGVTLLPFVNPGTNQPTNANYSSASVASGSPSMRNAFNAFLYTQIGTQIAGVVDTAACIETSPASQAGAGNGTVTNLNLMYADGLHPSQLGHQTIGACVAGSPAFQ